MWNLPRKYWYFIVSFSKDSSIQLSVVNILSNIITWRCYNKHTNLMQYWKNFCGQIKVYVLDFYIFHQMKALKELRNMFLVLSKKRYSFSRYSFFYFLLPLFFSLLPIAEIYKRNWLKTNPKVYDIIMCLNRNLHII